MIKPAKKALFVLHEGIGATIFNSQVIEHVKDMKLNGVDFDVLCFDTLRKTWTTSQKNQQRLYKSYPDINIVLKKAANIYYPASAFVNAFLLIKFLLKNKGVYSFIHARADYSAYLCVISKPFHGLKVIWDCRGDSVDEVKDSLKRKGLLVRIFGHLYLIPVDRLITYVNCKAADGAIFVSEALMMLFQRKLVTKNYSVIPCPVSPVKFYFNKDLRELNRKRLKISDNQDVYLYSGSMIAYQALKEQYDYYDQILKHPQNIVIIATPDSTQAAYYFKRLPQERLLIVSVGFDEMNAYYNLADFAFLLREKKRLNYVASPTKFGEYCLTGLPVIMNDTVAQSLTIAKEIGNYNPIAQMTHSRLSNEERENISISARKYFSRTALNGMYMSLYFNLRG